MSVSFPPAEMPWLWPYGGRAACFDSALQRNAGWVAQALNCERPGIDFCIPEFIESSDTLGALEYERQVNSGFIPTRDIAHDWYNGRVWLQFAQAKQLINACHVAESDKPVADSSNGRSRFRDALTLFDESGAVLLTTDASLSDALLQHDWSTLFVQNSSAWAERARVVLVGHGLLESMHRPYKGLCAKVIPVCVPTLDLHPSILQGLILQVAAAIRDSLNFSPMPVMGVPGWFDDSNVAGFYDDVSVFRAKPTPARSSVQERLAFFLDGSTLVSGKCAGQSLSVLRVEESPDSSEHSAG